MLRLNLFMAESELSLVAVLLPSASRNSSSVYTTRFSKHETRSTCSVREGNIGSSWLKLFAEQKEELEKRRGMNFELVAVVDSQTYWFDPQGIDPQTVLNRYHDESDPNEDNSWLYKVGKLQGYDDAIVLDVTASKVLQLKNQYLDIAEQGMHHISANKVAGSASTEYYNQVKDAFAKPAATGCTTQP